MFRVDAAHPQRGNARASLQVALERPFIMVSDPSYISWGSFDAPRTGVQAELVAHDHRRVDRRSFRLHQPACPAGPAPAHHDSRRGSTLEKYYECNLAFHARG